MMKALGVHIYHCREFYLISAGRRTWQLVFLFCFSTMSRVLLSVAALDEGQLRTFIATKVEGRSMSAPSMLALKIVPCLLPVFIFNNFITF